MSFSFTAVGAGRGLILVAALVVAERLDAAEVPPCAAEPSLPSTWRAAWAKPPLADRPLQIVHAVDVARPMPEGMEQMVPGSGAGEAAQRSMAWYVDRGLGGIVCNVAFQNYLQSEENWKKLAAAVEACRALGMVVWLYDEEGYPSGAAGGLVLRENPAFEAWCLALDRSRPEPLFLRAAYEHTHASNNYYAARRYINLLDDRAVGSFVAKTHEAYWRRLRPHFGTTIQAMFTDEPSLIAVNLGQIPEPARQKVRVVDPIDPAIQPFPSIPWGYDLVEQYQRRYGEDLMTRRMSLFSGDSASDRLVRSRFWALIADLVAERYFGALETWCRQHGVASSGHCLAEESLILHVPLVGNTLKALRHMHIPGLDMLSSDPEAVLHSGWLTAALPSSAAMCNGTRRVMTEVSDFSQKMSGQGPASLALMQAAAAWQAAWGVTEFTLYYSPQQRSADEYQAYGTYVGRLNAILKPAQMHREVLLYYPVRDLWEEYVPTAERLELRSQSSRAQRIVGSFMRLGQTLQRNQIPFALVDHEILASATPGSDGTLQIGHHRFTSLVWPAEVQVPESAAGVIERFERAGGRVLRDTQAKPLSAQDLREAIRPRWAIAPASERIALAVFRREDRTIVLLVNVGNTRYEGKLSGPSTSEWLVLDPADGSIRSAPKTEDRGLRLVLAPRQALFVVEDR